MLKIRRFQDHLIFNMQIPIPGEDSLYIIHELHSFEPLNLNWSNQICEMTTHFLMIFKKKGLSSQSEWWCIHTKISIKLFRKQYSLNIFVVHGKCSICNICNIKIILYIWLAFQRFFVVADRRPDDRPSWLNKKWKWNECDVLHRHLCISSSTVNESKWSIWLLWPNLDYH